MQPSTILHNTKAATNHSPTSVEAVVIRDGKIDGIGSSDEILRRRGDSTQVIDCGRRTIIPGLNDSHMHPIRGGLHYNLELRWDGVPSLVDALRMLKEQAAAKSAEADAATKAAGAARKVAAKKAADAAKAAKNLHVAADAKAKAEEALKAAERAVETASSPEGIRSPSVRQAELAQEKAAAKLAEAQTLHEADKEKVELKNKAEVKLAEAMARLESANEKAAAKLVETKAQLDAAKQKAAARLSDAQAQLEAAKSQAQARADEAARAEEAAKSDPCADERDRDDPWR